MEQSNVAKCLLDRVRLSQVEKDLYTLSKCLFLVSLSKLTPSSVLEILFDFL